MKPSLVNSISLIQVVCWIIKLYPALATNVIKTTRNQLSASTKSVPSRHYTYGKHHICYICNCRSKKAIKCFSETQNEQRLREWKNLTINSSFFDGFQQTVQYLFIDFDDYDLNLRLKHNAFASMKSLKIVFLTNIVGLSKVPNLELAEDIKEITIQDSDLRQVSTEFCLRKKQLQKIDWSYNQLSDLKYVFDQCSSLKLLDLSNNRVESLTDMFNEPSMIMMLNLEDNQIERLEQNDLAQLTGLTELSLAKNKIDYIHPQAFDKLNQLVKLNLAKNRLFNLPETSLVYSTVKYFDVSENKELIYFPDDKQFKSLKELRVYYSYHCCPFLNKRISTLHDEDDLQGEIDEEPVYLEVSPLPSDSRDSKIIHGLNSNLNVTDSILIAQPIDSGESDDLIDPESSRRFSLSDCKNREKLLKYPMLAYWCDKNAKHGITCTPMPDPLTPCKNLLDDMWLRFSVWFVSLMGILSNLCVVAYNIMYGVFYYYNNSDINVPTFLLTNLATADSLMSVYLLFIAVKDSTSREMFSQSAIAWQRSFSCNLAGFLSIVSSVSSALCLVFITFERYYSIKHSTDYNKQLRFKAALVVTTIIWIVSLFAAALPLFDFNNYSTYAICLPFDTRVTVYKIYIILINGLLVACFFCICVLYILIFVNTLVLERQSSSAGCNNDVQMRLRSAEDQKLARNITLLVMVNIICWGPIVYICAYSLITMTPIKRTHLKILAVFVIPFNSLINPFLYCISRRNFRMYLRAHFFRSQFGRRNFSNSSTRSTTSYI